MATVYSTDKGKLCPGCGEAVASCSCNKNPSFEQQEFVKLSRQTKGRKGKGVTLIEGIGGSESDLKTLAKSIKQLCNSGGAIKNGTIEIQGDHREAIKAHLEKKGYRIKIAGA